VYIFIAPFPELVNFKIALTTLLKLALTLLDSSWHKTFPIYSNKIDTSYFFYGLAFHFTWSSFRMSIYNNTQSLNHLVKKLLRSYRFSAKSDQIINLATFPLSHFFHISEITTFRSVHYSLCPYQFYLRIKALHKRKISTARK